MLQRIFSSPGGPDALDALMKYLYKGMAVSTSSSSSHGAIRTPTRQDTGTGVGFSQAMGGRPGAGDSSGAQMSVLLSWHEKVVDVAGAGCVVRVMTDRRRV